MSSSNLAVYLFVIGAVVTTATGLPGRIKRQANYNGWGHGGTTTTWATPSYSQSQWTGGRGGNMANPATGGSDHHHIKTSHPHASNPAYQRQAQAAGDAFVFNPKPVQVAYKVCPPGIFKEVCVYNPCPPCRDSHLIKCWTNPCGGCTGEMYSKYTGKRIYDCETI